MARTLQGSSFQLFNTDEELCCSKCHDYFGALNKWKLEPCTSLTQPWFSTSLDWMCVHTFDSVVRFFFQCPLHIFFIVHLFFIVLIDIRSYSLCILSLSKTPNTLCDFRCPTRKITKSSNIFGCGSKREVLRRPIREVHRRPKTAWDKLLTAAACLLNNQ